MIDLTQTDSESEVLLARPKKRMRYAKRPASSDNDEVVVLDEKEVRKKRNWAPVRAGAALATALDGNDELVVAGERGQVRAAQLAYSPRPTPLAEYKCIRQGSCVSQRASE